jgi:hypothetical protein
VQKVRKDQYRRRSQPRTLGGSYSTGWVGVILGSLMTFGITLIFSAIASIVVRVIFTLLGTAGASEVRASGLVGVSLTLLLAFYVGGYVAGRMASRSGAKRGLLMVLLALVVAMFLVVMGVIARSGFVNSLSGMRLPSALEDVRNLSTIMTVSGVLALILPLIGGAMGGVRGANMGRRRL